MILDLRCSLRLSPHLRLVVNHAVNSTDVPFNLVFFLVSYGGMVEVGTG